MSTAYAWYDAPFGRLLLSAEGECLTGLRLPRQDGRVVLPDDAHFTNTAILRETAEWLHCYFAGGKPHPNELNLRPDGTDFAREVWQLLCRIPYGSTTTYGAIASAIARNRGLSRMAAQAVGNAVGRNPIAIIIPCHRVIGAGGSLTGYAGGLRQKTWLLHWEGVL